MASQTLITHSGLKFAQSIWTNTFLHPVFFFTVPNLYWLYRWYWILIVRIFIGCVHYVTPQQTSQSALQCFQPYPSLRTSIVPGFMPYPQIPWYHAKSAITFYFDPKRRASLTSRDLRYIAIIQLHQEVATNIHRGLLVLEHCFSLSVCLQVIWVSRG